MKRAKQLFGKEFQEVHEWLDEFAMFYGDKHRVYRHNLRGVQYVREQWGDLAAKVAIQHILDDGYDASTAIVVTDGVEPLPAMGR